MNIAQRNFRPTGLCPLILLLILSTPLAVIAAPAGPVCIQNIHTLGYLSDVRSKLYGKCSTGEKWLLKKSGSEYCIQNVHTREFLSDGKKHYSKCSTGEKWLLVEIAMSDLIGVPSQADSSVPDQADIFKIAFLADDASKITVQADAMQLAIPQHESVFCLKNVYTEKYLSDEIEKLYPSCSVGEVWRIHN